MGTNLADLPTPTYDPVVWCGVIAALAEEVDDIDPPVDLVVSHGDVGVFVCDPIVAGLAARHVRDGVWAEFAALELAHRLVGVLGAVWASEAERLADDAVSYRSSHVNAALALMTVGPVAFDMSDPADLLLPGGALTAATVNDLLDRAV